MSEGWGQYEDIEAKENGTTGKASQQQNQGANDEASHHEGEPGDSEGDSEALRKKMLLLMAKKVEEGEEDSKSAKRFQDRPLSAPHNKVVSDEALHKKSSKDAAMKRLEALDLSVEPSPSCPNFGSLEAAHKRIFDSGLTFSEAKGQLWELRKAGMLMKRGFRYRKLWVRRFVELSGRMLKYYEKRPNDNKTANSPRGKLELTKYTAIVILPPSNGHKFAFNVLPDGNNPKLKVNANKLPQRPQTGGSFPDSFIGENVNASATPTPEVLLPPVRNDLTPNELDILHATTTDDKIWRFIAKDERELQDWVHVLEKAVNLIRRVEVAPTLCGVGSVHYHYHMEEKIGQGRFGDVYRAVAALTEQEYAIKVVEKEKRVKTKDDALVLRNEIKILRRVTRELDHTNICKLFQAYEDSSTVYLVLENLCGGNLFEHLSEYTDQLLESTVADIIRQLAGALSELHGAGIILCDIRPENLLYTSPDASTIKVVEFGRAMIVLGPGAQANKPADSHTGPATFTTGVTPKQRATVKRAQLVGDPQLIAPEVVAAREYSSASDIWSLGCILFMLLVGYAPFQGNSPQEIFQASALGLQADKLVQEDWDQVSGDARLVVASMLRTSPTKRATAEEILDNPWMITAPDTPLSKTHERIRNLYQKGLRVMSPTRGKPRVLSPRRAAHATVTAPTTKPRSASTQLTPDRQRSREDMSQSRWSVQNLLEHGRQASGKKMVVDGLQNIERGSSSALLDLADPSKSAAERREEILALDVRAERIRAQQQNEDEWNLPRSPRNIIDDYQANFAPAGRFLNELESQMRLVREDEQAKVAKQQLQQQQQQQSGSVPAPMPARGEGSRFAVSEQDSRMFPSQGNEQTNEDEGGDNEDEDEVGSNSFIRSMAQSGTVLARAGQEDD